MNKGISLEDALLNVPQAIIAGGDDKVLFANEAAMSFLGSDPRVRPLSELFSEDILSNNSEHFVAASSVGGRQVRLTVRRSGEQKLFYIDSPEEKPETPAFTRGALSHLRSCLTGLKLAADRCFEPVEDGELPGKNNISVLYHYYYRLSRAVLQLDSADKLARHEMSFSPHPLEIDSFLAELVQTVESLCRPMGVTIKYTRESGRLFALVDAELFEMMMLNLLANSIQNAEENTVIELSAKETSDGVLIALNDTGSGIPSGKLGDVFHLPENGSPTSPEEGTGMGLYIANAVVRLHGGVLLIESREDKGVSIRIQLPSPEEGQLSFSTKLAEYNHRGISPILTGLAEVLPSDCFGTMFED